MAVLRLPPPKSTTLFFDDTPSSTHRFLGLVTSIGNVLLVEPSYHARFIGNNRHENGYLCHGKTGVIEKEFLWNCSTTSEEMSYPSVIDQTLQLQINSSMQLEYHQPSNISFAFQCENERFQYQLGVQLPRTLCSTTKNLPGSRRVSQEKSPSILFKRLNSDESKLPVRSSSNEKLPSRSLTPMEELTILRKRIEHLCQNWLEQCRTTLGSSC